MILRPDNLQRFIASLREQLQEGPLWVSVEPMGTRTLEQNDKLNAMCGDVAEQVVWYGQKMSPDWRRASCRPALSAA